MKYIFLLLLLFLIILNPAYSYKTVEFISEFGGKGEALGKFSDKIHIKFDKIGNIYILDEDNLCIQKLDIEGKPIFSIKPNEQFLLIDPKDIAVDDKMNIYVLDWKSVHIEGTESPKVFNYGVCIHKFSEKGDFIESYNIENLGKTPIEKERAFPAIDIDGNFALLIVPNGRDRKLFISVDSQGNIYVINQNRIHKLSPSGEPLIIFGKSSDGSEQIYNPTGIAIDSKNNIYVADSGNNRISKFSSEGKFLLSFGKKGEKDGNFIGDLYIVSASDGTILVADSARYEKLLKTQLDRRNITDSLMLVTGQVDPSIPKNREFLTIIKRFQRFDENGRFIEKFLYRIDKTDIELHDIEFKAIDSSSNLYLLDKDRIVIRKYRVLDKFNWSSVDKVFTYRYLHHDSRGQLDNPSDLNSYYDFDERLKYSQMVGIIRFDYDVTESFHVAFSSHLSHIGGKTTDKYPDDSSGFRGYIQDDIAKEKYISARLRLDMSLILEHDPFRYREGNFFIYFGGGRYDYSVDAIDVNNERILNEKLWWSVWASGLSYDTGSSMRLSFIASQHKPMGYMNYNYTYLDEEGMLYATGARKGTTTRIYLMLEGAF